MPEPTDALAATDPTAPGAPEAPAPPAPVVVALPTAEATRALGRALGRLLRAGDLLVLTGDLGAGKTTLTQGLGEGLGIRGPVTSPTFVIARLHPSLVGGPGLVHADAYRLGGGLELDDLDLDASLDDSVTVVEWGRGVAELLSPDRLELVLTTAPRPELDDAAAAEGDVGDAPRTATLTSAGPRWSTPEARAALDALRIA